MRPRGPGITASTSQVGDKMDRLKGKVILISGGARGQGAAEARLVADLVLRSAERATIGKFDLIC